MRQLISNLHSIGSLNKHVRIIHSLIVSRESHFLNDPQNGQLVILKEWSTSSIIFTVGRRDRRNNVHKRARGRPKRRQFMKKTIIVYESLYGNTKKIAEAISEGINKVDGVECVVKKTGEIHTDDLCDYDAIILGCPNHNQGPALNLVKFIDRASIVHLSGKIGAAFDTYTGGNKDVAVAKLETKIREKLPGIELISRLSSKATGRKGPLADDEESRALDFGTQFAKRLVD